MRKRTTWILAVLMILVLTLSACGSVYPLNIEGVQINAKPKKAAVLSYSAFQIVKDSYSEAIVAAYENNDKDIQSIGNSMAVNVDACKKLGVDLLICDIPLPEEETVALQDAGVTVLVMNRPTTYEQLVEYYQNLEMIFQGKLSEDGIAKSFQNELDEALNAEKVDKSFVLVVNSYGMVSGKDSLDADLFSRLLGTNVAAENTEFSSNTSDYIETAPQIFLTYEGMTEEEQESIFSGYEELALYEYDEQAFISEYSWIPSALKDVMSALNS